MDSSSSGSEEEYTDEDDWLNDQYDDPLFDAGDFEDGDRVSSLLDSLLQSNEATLPLSLGNNGSRPSRIRSAMGHVNGIRSTAAAPISGFGDFILRFLTTSQLNPVGETKSYYLPKNAIDNNSTPIATQDSKIFVGNIVNEAKWSDLKDYFENRGFLVKNVEMKAKPGKAKYAFVRFASDSVAQMVLYNYEKNNSYFMFHNRALTIGRPKNEKKLDAMERALKESLKPQSVCVTYDISDIHYGTLLSGAAMKNIYKRKSIVSNDGQLGVIAHSFDRDQRDVPLQLEINPEKRKISFVGHDSYSDYTGDRSTSLSLEWNFGDLKGHRISPVVVDLSFNEQKDRKEIFLLLEVKRPPIILRTETFSNQSDDVDTKIRLPGTPLIGHANVWLFRLKSKTPTSQYPSLFEHLSRNNLTQRGFHPSSINHLIRTLEIAQRNLETVLLLSNDVWIERNQVKVQDFINNRWPLYPFEVKFEIMKLISKHIITVNDLIVDDHAERILKQCSTNTLIACADKILEKAREWIPDINYDDELYPVEGEGEEENTELVASVSTIPNTSGASGKTKQIITSTGETLSITNVETDPVNERAQKLVSLFWQRNLGIFSRLLVFALNELCQKHKLRRDQQSKVYVTTQELRSSWSESSMVRKIFITPSTIFYEGPYREERCAVTRQFETNHDQFLRVAFRDEDFSYLRNYNDNMSNIYELIEDMLVRGVHICDRKYDFLAFSSSQLRDHGCWMFASLDNRVNTDSIRRWMGDFKGVRPVAKYAARLGQSFSTSMKGIRLERRQFREISDVTRADSKGNDLCFTDGIGIISKSFAKELFKTVHRSDFQNANTTDGLPCPCAFQVRCGGFKGMVCIDVANSIIGAEAVLYFRKSMSKFRANDHSIDVVHTSIRAAMGYLNRQIILLLSSLGIDDQVFLELQKQMLQKLMGLTRGHREACESLKDLNEYGGNGSNVFLMKFLQTMGDMKEPFTHRLLLAFQTFAIKELRTRAKIRVKKSWNLFGVVDETRLLQYGEVFIQVDDPDTGGRTKIITGPVVVTRNPCFHPGDIRRLQAVDKPALRELKNVIVFPMNGPRPHPMEMSGGDLDGDTFWVCQNEKLVFTSNEEPFDYKDQEMEAKPEPLLGSLIEFITNDVCKFFVQYIEADNLGVIANSHLAIADGSPQKAKDPKCLQLAKMHSTAVDFAKTGVPVPSLIKDLRPTAYPHFMEKKDKPSYQSTSILGQLYDDIKACRIDLDINQAQEIRDAQAFPYRSFIVTGHEDYKQEASIMRNEYDREVKRVMRQYGIKQEVELVSGHILKFHSKQYSNQTKLFDLKNEIAHAYRLVRDKYLRIFWKEIYQPATSPGDEENEDDDDANTQSVWSEVSKKLMWHNQNAVFEYYGRGDEWMEKAKKKASAWFVVTYEPWIKFMRQNNPNQLRNGYRNPNEQLPQYRELLSFAWLVYPILLNIYQEKHPNINDGNTNSKRRRRKKKNKNKNNNKSTN